MLLLKFFMAYFSLFVQSSEFCLLLPGHRLTSPDLLDAMMSVSSPLLCSERGVYMLVCDGAVCLYQGCIPIFLRNDHILPFSEELEWSRASLLLWQQELPRVEELLEDIGQRVKESMRQQVLWTRCKYRCNRDMVMKWLVYFCLVWQLVKFWCV